MSKIECLVARSQHYFSVSETDIYENTMAVCEMDKKITKLASWSAIRFTVPSWHYLN